MTLQARVIDNETVFTSLRDITGLHQKGPWRLIVIAQQLAVVRATDGVVRPWHQIEALWIDTPAALLKDASG